jgi:hypothetical protein
MRSVASCCSPSPSAFSPRQFELERARGWAHRPQLSWPRPPSVRRRPLPVALSRGEGPARARPYRQVPRGRFRTSMARTDMPNFQLRSRLFGRQIVLCTIRRASSWATGKAGIASGRHLDRQVSRISAGFVIPFRRRIEPFSREKKEASPAFVKPSRTSSDIGRCS